MHGPLLLPHLFELVLMQRGELEEYRELRERYEAAPSERARRRMVNAARPGRPNIRISAPKDAIASAWLADGCGYSQPRVTEYLGLGGSSERSARSTGAKYVRTGRKLLNDIGVLPWTLWPDGKVPDRWWESPVFLAGLNVWADRIAQKRDDLDRLRSTHAHLVHAALAHAGRPPRGSQAGRAS